MCIAIMIKDTFKIDQMNGTVCYTMPCYAVLLASITLFFQARCLASEGVNMAEAYKSITF